MLSCIDLKSAEYQTLLLRSGVSSDLVEAISRAYMTKYGRLPYLDEIPKSNSEPALKKFLKLNSNNSTSLENLSELLSTTDPLEMQAKLNNQFRDLEVQVLPINTEAIITIKHQPNTYNFEVYEVEQDAEINNAAVFNTFVSRLADVYGIKIHSVTNAEMSLGEWLLLHGLEALPSANAFILNGEIYVNTDLADVDAPVHEMLHILLGGVSISLPQFYNQLIERATGFSNFSSLAKPFTGRTLSDILEEVFVQELAKYLIGKPSAITSLPENVIHEINYNVKRLLDIMVGGLESVRILNDASIMLMSLKELAEYTNSLLFINTLQTALLSEAKVHRRLNNAKAEMIRKNELREECN